MPVHRAPVLRRSLAAAVAALAAAAGADGAAAAPLGTTPCGEGGQRCGTLRVPLDRSDAVPGTVRLAFARRPAAASGAPSAEALVALAGGPGQPALPFADDFASSLGPLLRTRDLVVFDQRGTGSSDPLRCAAFGARGPSSSADVRACAGELGPARGLYRSVDSAEDIEALRRAGGYERLVLYGVSYGTKVALTYAARHPGRVAALVLDSVVPLDGPDALGRPSFAALGRVLRELCAARRCRGITSDARRDLRRLAARVAARPLSGAITGPTGRRTRVSLDADGLWQVLLAGDLNPTLRAELPAAVRAALSGDATPALRLRGRSLGLGGAGAARAAAAPRMQASTAANDVLFAATRCEETDFPWDRDASTLERSRQADDAVGRIPARAFAPFGRSVAVTASVLPLCVGWPDASPAPAAPGPLPDVPTLALAGAADLRTPVEEARRAVAGIAGARVDVVPSTGHSVIGSDLGGCVDEAIGAFADGSVSACRPTASPFAPTPVPPRRLSAVRGATLGARTAAAVRATITDVRRQLIGDAIAAQRPIGTGARTGGLRGGAASVEGERLVLRRVAYVPGLRVSGQASLRAGGAAQVAVSGAARGSLRIAAGGAVSGTVNGRRVRLAAPSAAGPADAWDALAGPLPPAPRPRAALRLR